jgi:hypothetical protein
MLSSERGGRHWVVAGPQGRADKNRSKSRLRYSNCMQEDTTECWRNVDGAERVSRMPHVPVSDMGFTKTSSHASTTALGLQVQHS